MIFFMSGSDCRLFICLITQGYFFATKEDVGLTVNLTGFGRHAAIIAASARLSFFAECLKYFLQNSLIPLYFNPIFSIHLNVNFTNLMIK